MRIFLTLLLCWIGWAHAANVTLNGRVVTGVNPQSLSKEGLGEPLAGVEVEILGTPHHAVTDASGYFAISELPDGQYTLLCRKGGFSEQRMQVRVAYAGFPARCQVTMNAPNQSILGDVALGSGSVFVAYSKRHATENIVDVSPFSLTVQKAMAAGVQPRVFWAEQMPPLPMMPQGPGMAHLMNEVTALENCLMGYSPSKPARSGFLEVPGPSYWPCFNREGTVLYLALQRGILQIRDARRANDLIRNLPLGGFISSVQLDASGKYLVVAHANPNGVTLIDTGTNLPAASVATSQAPNAALLLHNRLYVVSGNVGKGLIQAVDVNSGKVVASQVLGSRPTSLAASRDLKKLYVACSGSGEVQVLETVDLQPFKSYRVEVQPHQLAISPDGTRCFVCNKQSNSVSVIDLQAGEIAATIRVGQDPTGLAFSRDGRQCFVACRRDGCVMTLDGKAGTLLHTTIPMPHAVPTGVAVKP